MRELSTADYYYSLDLVENILLAILCVYIIPLFRAKSNRTSAKCNAFCKNELGKKRIRFLYILFTSKNTTNSELFVYQRTNS